MEENDKNSNRRGFVRKLLGLGAAAGATSLLLASDKSLIPLAQAGSGSGATVNIDQANYGVGVTELFSTATSGAAFAGYATATSSASAPGVWGVYGRSDTPTGKGVFGEARSTTINTSAWGVYGKSDSPMGRGVYGYATASSGASATYGVYGQSDSKFGNGVYGYAHSGSGTTYGVYGKSDSTGGLGVYGSAAALSGTTYGVYGVSESTSGRGVYGLANSSTGLSYGVYGESKSDEGYGIYGIASAGTGYGCGVLGWSISTSGIGVFGMVSQGSGKPIVAQGAPDQTANLQVWQDWTAKALSVVDKSGWLGVGVSTPARSVHLQGSNACFRMDRNANSAAFILVRTAAGDFNTIWKTFYVGVDASGVNNGEFFIGDRGNEVAGDSQKRLIIDNVGNIVPPSDNTGNIGTAARRWSLIRGVTVQSGDLAFENNYRVTEDETDGLAFKNPEGEKIAVLDREGNFHIKGKVMEDL